MKQYWRFYSILTKACFNCTYDSIYIYLYMYTYAFKILIIDSHSAKVTESLKNQSINVL